MRPQSSESTLVSTDEARLLDSPPSQTTTRVCVFDPHCLEDGELIVKNTFLEYQKSASKLRRCQSLPGLPGSIPGPPSDNDSCSLSEVKTQERTGSSLSTDLPCSSTCEDVGEPADKVDEGAAEAPSTAVSDKNPLAVGPRVDPTPRTTIMLRHLPNNYTQEMFLAMVKNEGFADLFDFVYLPTDFRTRAGLGYAFVNLTDPEAVPRFWDVFEGYTNWDLPTQKVCELSWSTPLQGLTAHIERFRNHPVMHPTVPDNFKPMLFQKGVRVPFPAPTKSIKAPFAKKLCR